MGLFERPDKNHPAPAGAEWGAGEHPLHETTKLSGFPAATVPEETRTRNLLCFYTHIHISFMRHA
jgi:hypothetical protein